MRRGYRNRWAYDQSPQGDSDEKPKPVTVNNGLWHHTLQTSDADHAKRSAAATLRTLDEYGWLPTSKPVKPIAANLAAKILPEPLKRLGRLGYPE